MKRNTRICEKCLRPIALSSYMKHFNVCGQTKTPQFHIKEEWKTESGEYKCPYCDRIFSKRAISTHIWRTHGEGINHKPFDKFHREGISTPSWNRGLTKETNETVKNAGIKYSNRIKSGELKPSMKDRHLSAEQKQKLSDTICEKVENGTWHYSFSKTRTHEYESKFAGKVLLHGSWELAYAKYLDASNIPWRRPKEKFYYEYRELKNGCGYYIPDFYLTEEKKYVEIKGYETDKDRAKWKWFPHALEVIKSDRLVSMGLIEKYK